MNSFGLASVEKKNNNWKIYDLSVEGVSLLQSFRSQFGQILQNSSMKNLIAEMKKNSKAIFSQVGRRAKQSFARTIGSQARSETNIFDVDARFCHLALKRLTKIFN